MKDVSTIVSVALTSFIRYIIIFLVLISIRGCVGPRP